MVGKWIGFILAWIVLASFAVLVAYGFGGTRDEPTWQQEETVVGYYAIATRDAQVRYVTTTRYRTCADGWNSPSIGKQGACSWHGGVVTRERETPREMTTTCDLYLESESKALLTQQLKAPRTKSSDWMCEGIPQGAEVRAVLGQGELTYDIEEMTETESVEVPADFDHDQGVRFGALAFVGAVAAGVAYRPSKWDTY